MGCAPSKDTSGQPASTPRATPVTPPLKQGRGAGANPLDARPLPAIGGGGRRLEPVREEEGPLAGRNVNMDDMVKDARDILGEERVRHTKSGLALTIDGGDPTDGGGGPKPLGRLPPLIREKTMMKEHDSEQLRETMRKKQEDAENRRNNHFNSSGKKKKKRRVRLKNHPVEEPKDESPTVVPPLELDLAADPFATKKALRRSPEPPKENPEPIVERPPTHQVVEVKPQPQLIDVRPQPQVIDVRPQPQVIEVKPPPRNDSAHHDSTYGSGDERRLANNDFEDDDFF